MTNLAADLRAAADGSPGAPAIATGGGECTYSELWSAVERFAAGLDERGVVPGDRVAIALPNGPAFVVGALGTLAAGGTLVTLDPRGPADRLDVAVDRTRPAALLTRPEVAGALDDPPAATVVVDEPRDGAIGFDALLSAGERPPVERADDDPALIAPARETREGDRRRSVFTHGALRAAASIGGSVVPEGMDGTDRVLGVAPLWHVFGLTTVLVPALVAGASYHPMEANEANEALDPVERGGITTLFAGLSTYRSWLVDDATATVDLSSLRFCGALEGPVPPVVRGEIEERFGARLYEGYGRAETGTLVHFDRPKTDHRPGSVGLPIDGTDTCVVTEDYGLVPPVEAGPITGGDDVELDDVTGEIVVSGPALMERYFDDSEATDAAFSTIGDERVFHTRDVGYRDSDGYLYVIGEAGECD